MYLTDFHVHSSYSSDAESTMEEMITAAIERGISRMCFTDHADDCVDDSHLSHQLNYVLKRENAYDEFLELREKYGSKIDLRYGAEVASPNHDPETAEKIFNNKEFDFIIGSCHNIRATNDFYFLEYDDPVLNKERVDKYIDEHFEMARIGGFDVFGHIGYMFKYMHKHGVEARFTKDQIERIEELFKFIIPRSLGIEVNTSPLRGGMDITVPYLEVLTLYRELGGEIVTVGSDSHIDKDVGANISDAYELLKEAGFRFLTTFKNRHPEFVKI